MTINTSSSTDYQGSIVHVEDQVWTGDKSVTQRESEVKLHHVEPHQSIVMFEEQACATDPLRQQYHLQVPSKDTTKDSIAGVEVQLKDSTGTLVATTTTALDGSYSFRDVEPGHYHLQFTAPTGYAFTFPTLLGEEHTPHSASTITQLKQKITLESGEFNDSLGAGLILTKILVDPVPCNASVQNAKAELESMENNTVTLVEQSAVSVTPSDVSRDNITAITATNGTVETKTLSGDYKAAFAALVSYLNALNSLQLT
ncbi:MAG: SdrD B-like domain-containing protein [Prochlorotrichaceae cyanobacterium]